MWQTNVEISVVHSPFADWDKLFKEKFNPPNARNEFEQELFNQEFAEVLFDFEKLLSQHGDVYNSTLRPSDFALNEYHGFSRWIELLLQSPRLIGPHLPKLILSYLGELKFRYAVWLNCDYRSDIQDPDLPYFDIVFQKDLIVVRLLEPSDYADLVAQLGFPVR